MTGEGRKREKPLYLDMDFSEALERFAQADPREVRESIERAKEEKPPGEQAAQGLTRKRRARSSEPTEDNS